MGILAEGITTDVAEWIDQQHLFFVGTAPLSGEGHVNLSPKGLDSLRVLDPWSVAYLDLVGSGVETIAHVRENQRLTIMFCSFDAKPRILRLYGKAEVHELGTERFDALADRFPSETGARAIITLSVDRVSSTCGFGVPLMTFEAERPTLRAWAERKGTDALVTYKQERNAASIDGLVGLVDLDH